MMSSISLQPIDFFRARLLRRPQWFIASMGPLACLVLHWLTYSLVHSRVTIEIQRTVTTLGLGPIPANWIYISDLFGAAGFVLFPILAAILISCIDVLTKDTPELSRLFEFAGLSFYTVIPLLAVALLLSVQFVPPKAPQPASMSEVDLPQFVQDYAFQVRNTPVLRMIQFLNFLAYLGLAFLIGLAYRALSPCSRRAGLAVTAVVFLMSILAL